MIQNEVEDPGLAEEIQKVYSEENHGTLKAPTSRRGVLEQFGPPHKIGALGAGRYAFGYEYRHVVERQVGIAVPGYSILKIGAGKTGAERLVFIIEFSEADEVLAAGPQHGMKMLVLDLTYNYFSPLHPHRIQKAS